MEKFTAAPHTAVEYSSEASASDRDSHGGNGLDQSDMDRMGKKQELQRNFRFVSIVGFVSILQATWESTLVASYIGLLNGGTAGLVWLTIICWLFFLTMIASMAEMASMAPTAGGQYHWVSEFAPESWQKPASYIVGWTCCLGWVAGTPACAQIFVGLVQGLVLLVYPDANVAQLWQTALLIWAVMLIAFAFNIWGAKYLPAAENFALVLHAVGFLAFLVTMWAVGDHAPAEQVFTQFQDGGNWGSLGVSTLVGIGSPLWFFIGPDAAAHMSEELQDASLTLPRAMMWSTFVNGIVGIVMLITFCFCITDVNAVLNTPTDQPVLAVLYSATGSYVASCILGSLLAILTFFGLITNVATASRQCWAFARDGGFPASKWLSRVHRGYQIPLNSLYMCAVVSFILAAINFGSSVAFSAVIAISNAALVFSYFLSVLCIRLKRWRGEPLLPRRWSLGRWGSIVNDLTLAFLAVAFVFSFFPSSVLDGDPTWAQDMNWACVVFVACCLLASVYYLFGGRNIYIPPVRLVKTE